jgi:hypothetical protein
MNADREAAVPVHFGDDGGAIDAGWRLVVVEAIGPKWAHLRLPGQTIKHRVARARFELARANAMKTGGSSLDNGKEVE